MSWKNTALVAFIAMCCCASPCEQQQQDNNNKRIYMRRDAMQDQATAASGYMYHSDSNGPTSYMQYNSGSGNLDNFGYPPITLGHYAQAPKLQPAPPIPYLPQVQYYNQQPVLLQPPHPPQELKKYEAGGGEAHDGSTYSKQGENGDSGYKNVEGYEKGTKGEHGEKSDNGFYKKEGGNKEGNHEESEQYGTNHAATNGSKGGSFSKANSHKKGSKTTGFHKVYHKDEYKKDHTFYDESDSRGHYDKYGNVDSEHSAHDGGYKKGGRTASGFHDNKFGKKGFYDKGNYHNHAGGYKGGDGSSEYRKNHADYSKDAAAHDDKHYGYKNSDEGDESDDDRRR